MCSRYAKTNWVPAESFAYCSFAYYLFGGTVYHYLPKSLSLNIRIMVKQDGMDFEHLFCFPSEAYIYRQYKKSVNLMGQYWRYSSTVKFTGDRNLYLTVIFTARNVR